MQNQDSSPVMPSAVFREIHKNAFLKRNSGDKRAGFPRKPEKIWTVFCIHDDSEAYLEVYPDDKIALAHKPEWFVSLHTAQHVTPSICGQAEDFEFAITLPTQVVRLAAPSWDAMMEWVNTISNKLRELRVIAPKENLYTKMPEPRHALLPTRDPTSPLPLPPPVPATIVPGIERPNRTGTVSPPGPDNVDDTELGSRHARNGVNGNLQFESLVISQPNRLQSDSRSTDSVLNNSSRPDPRDSQDLRERASEFHVISTRDASQNVNFLRGGTDIPACVSSPVSSGERRRDVISSVARSGSSSVVIVNDEIGRSAHSRLESHRPEVSSNIANVEENAEGFNSRNNRAGSATNVTVIEVPPATHYEHLFPSEDERPSQESRLKLERVNSSGLIPRVPPRRDGESRAAQVVSPPRVRDRVNTSQNEGSPSAASVSSPVIKSAVHTSVVTVVGRERAPSPPREASVETSGVRVTLTQSMVDTPGPSRTVIATQVVPPRATSAVQPVVETVPPMPAAFLPAPALDVREIPLIGGHQRRRRRSSSSDAAPASRGLAGADLIRVTPAEAPDVGGEVPRRTLREAQVCQLRLEMRHPGGVRLPLRRKDCVGSMALVDIVNAVWVAGWKQREHPMLYNALHIGDQLVSIGDVHVRNATEAQRLLRSAAGPTIDIVVRRLPLGVVLTVLRPRGNGDIGLVPDVNNAAEISVVPGGAVAQTGLPLRTTTMDGLSLTPWALTEINGRPLSLFCKPSDVVARLNSVGKELSILVQPSDFIKQVRKQVKAMRGYKDYLLM